MERKSVLNEHFIFKKLLDGTLDRTTVICIHCQEEFKYHRSNSSLNYHLRAKHTVDASKAPQKQTQRTWLHLLHRCRVRGCFPLLGILLQRSVFLYPLNMLISLSVLVTGLVQRKKNKFAKEKYST